MNFKPSFPKPSRNSGWIGFAIIALVLVFGGGEFYRQKAQEVRQEQHQLIAAIGELKSGQIQSWRTERLADARRVARGLVMRRRTAELLHDPKAWAARADLLEVLNTNKIANSYDSIHLVTREGRVLLSSETGSMPIVPPTQEGITAALVSETPVFSGFFRGPDGGTFLDVMAWVRDHSGSPLAAVVLRIRANGYLFPLIQNWPLPSRSAETVLTVRSGEEALVPHRLRAENERAEPWHMPLTETNYPSVQVVLGKRGVAEGVDYRGMEVLADLREIPNSNWFIHCKIDKDEAFAGLHADALFISMITAAFILLAGAAFAYSYRQRQARHFKERYEAEQRKLEAEGSLRASENRLSQVSERLSLAIRAGGVGIWEWDVIQDQIFWDEQMYRLYGIPPDQFGGVYEAWQAGLHPDDAARGDAETRMALRGDKEFDTEFRVVWPDGSIHSIRGMAIVQRDAGGRPLRMVGTNWDITSQKQTEAALKASEAGLLQSQSIAGLGSYTLDIASGKWSSSEVLNGIFGIEGDYDHSVANWVALIHPEWQETMARYFEEEVVGSGQPFDKEYKILRAIDGAERWVHGRGELEFDELGAPTRMLGTIMDITDRKRGEEELKRSEAALTRQNDLLSSLLEVLPMGVFMVEVPSGKRLVANEAALNLLGRGVLPDASPQNLAEVYRAYRLGTHDPYPLEEMPIMLGMRGLTSHVDDLVIERPDGSTRLLEIFGTPVRDKEGRIWASLVSFYDITERKQAELALQLTRFSIENASDGMFWITPEGRFSDVNEAACRSLGYAREELLTLSVADIDAHIDREIWPHHFAELRERGTLKIESDQVRRNGQVFPVEVVANYLRFGGEERNCAFVRDITERRRAEAEHRKLETMLHHSQKMESLGLLAGGVAHDMNNVLAAILGLSSAHLELQPEGSATRRAFDTIVKACARGGTLVKGLLSISRRGLSEEVVLDLNALIREEVQLLEHTTLAKVRLEMDLAADLPAILGDGGALSHALMNLCVNAVDAMPDGGTLTFRTRRGKDQVEVSVEDTGQGMPPSVLERALEPFFTTKAQGKGTGLGLSIVYSILKAHRGEMGIQSRPGKGTRIEWRFPAYVPPPPDTDQTPDRDSEHLSKKASPAMHVLLVDDDELVSSSVSELIELLGYTATPAFSGEEALEILNGGLPVDAVILDLNMPGLGGAATLPRLRELRPDLPVFLATGRVEQTVLDLVKDFPRVTLMSKPFTMDELRTNLRDARG